MEQPPPGTWDRVVLREQIKAGYRSVIAIDDTAPSGVAGATPGQKTHVAIVVTRDRLLGVLRQMNVLQERLVEACGTDTFHFRQLFSARGPYEGLSLEARLCVIYEFVGMFSRFEIPIWASTFDPQKIQEVGADLPTKLGTKQQTMPGGSVAFQWDDPTALSRFAAIAGALDHLRQDSAWLPASAYMDRAHVGMGDWCPRGQDDAEGNHTYTLEPLDPPVAFGEIAAENPFVQMADFAAWSYTKIGLLAARLPLTKDWDIITLALLRPILRRYRYEPEFLDKLADIWGSPTAVFRPNRFRLSGIWGGEDPGHPFSFEVSSSNDRA